MKELATGLVIVGLVWGEALAASEHNTLVYTAKLPDHSHSHVPTERTGEFPTVGLSAAASGTASTETWQIFLSPSELSPENFCMPTRLQEEAVAPVKVFRSTDSKARTQTSVAQSSFPHLGRSTSMLPRVRRSIKTHHQKQFLFKRP